MADDSQRDLARDFATLGLASRLLCLERGVAVSLPLSYGTSAH